MTFRIASLCFLSCVISTTHSPALYSAALIRYLAEHHPYGTFDCWFYKLSKFPLETNMLYKIVTSEELASIPIRVLCLSEAAKFDHHPQLLLIFCDDWTQQFLESLHNFLVHSRFKASLKIIVFYEHLYVKQLVLIQTAFTYSNLFNVIFIRTDRLQVHYYLVYKKRFVSSRGAVPYGELFPDQSVDLAGREMYLSTSRNDPDQLVSTPKRLFKGRVYEWVLNTVEHYNGTVVIHRLAPEHNLYVLNSTHLYTFCLEMMSFLDTKDTFLLSAYPDRFLVAAPAGRRYEIREVLFMPFSPALWILIITLGGFFYASMVLFPRLFKNDILNIAIVILSFLLCSAYEAKIITFMINAPYAANPRTFEDLLEGGITINMSTRTSIELLGDPKYEQVFKYSPGIPAMRYHPKMGYYARSNDIRLGIVDPVNYDLRTKRSMLVILDRFPLGSFVHFYYVGPTSPLRDKFQRTELVFYEAGLMDFWTKRIFREYFGIKYSRIVEDGNGPEDETLGMIHLVPIFKGMLIGLGLATLVFVGEVCFYLKKIELKFVKCLRRFKSNKILSLN